MLPALKLTEASCRSLTYPPLEESIMMFSILVSSSVTVYGNGNGQVNEKMQVLRKKGDDTPMEGLYCIGDANGKYMLAHAASAQVYIHASTTDMIVIQLVWDRTICY